MATRASRLSSVTQSTPVKSHTPTVATPTRQRPPSPLSPTRQSRTDEKFQMQNLNDRLASYIDEVRKRDIEIASLKTERSTIEETHISEKTKMKSKYCSELAHLRKAVDEISKEKARMGMEVDKCNKEAKESNSGLLKMEKKLEELTKELRSKNKKLVDAETKLNKLEEDMEILMPENKKLARELTDVRSRLEEESLKSTDLQNQLQTKEETLKFENSILEQELNETRIKKQMEISEIDSRISDAYETQMQQSMKELRETYDKQLSESREELSRVYDDKLNKLQARLDDAKTNNAGTEQEAREYETKISVLTSRNVELEAANSSLQKRMAHILKEMEDKEANFRNEMAKKNALVKNKEEQMEETLKDYKKLLELKITLDCEIEAYRKMLEGEESRLGMSMTDSPDCSNGRGVKRTRTMLEESITENATEHNGLGTIQIEPINKGEKSISLTNKMKEEISIGGWSLMNETEGNISTYKFHTSITLPPLSSCTVFSADCNEEHSPPTTLVMKKGGWVIGAQNKTVLTNKDGAEEAVRLSRAEKRQVGSIRSKDDNSCTMM